ncbi:amino acid adenylation domain-containing protein [Microbulbifer sp. CnH-101-G]|uniref:amino acid adenylation domain-containing protein n=1 Tax=Microbulbifer sp. CnH-101-G TaxID=3243393 RepID=UPI004039962A
MNILIDKVKFSGPAYQEHRDFWCNRLNLLKTKTNLESARNMAENNIKNIRYEFSKSSKDHLAHLSNDGLMQKYIILSALFSYTISYLFSRETLALKSPRLKDDTENHFVEDILYIFEPRRESIRTLLKETKEVIKDTINYSNFPYSFFDESSNITNIGFRINELHESQYKSKIENSILFNSNLNTFEVEFGDQHDSVYRYIFKTIDRILSSGRDLDQPIINCVIPPDNNWLSVPEFKNGNNDSNYDLTIVDALKTICSEYGNKVAAVHQNENLTYDDLDKFSTYLASIFHERFNINTGDRVAIIVERSNLMLVAMLAILKSGASFIPLSPEWPQKRLKKIIDSSNCKLSIINSDLMVAASDLNTQFYILDLEFDNIIPSGDFYTSVDPDDIAYIMFTSGSTGEPKGVEITHRAIMNTLRWRKNFYKITPDDINLQFPSPYFDSSIVDIWSFLISGSKLILPLEHKRLDGKYLSSIFNLYQITRMMMVPSIYMALTESHPKIFRGLVSITLAGESVGVAHVSRHFELYPDSILINEYGPTENSVCSTAKVMGKHEAISIGKPIDNTYSFIVNKFLEPLPPYFSGEILVGGAGLALGYVDDHQLTSEKFIYSPWSRSQIYRTGDKGILLEHGEIQFLGRIDSDEVKISGVRISLAEIENTLRGLDDVFQAIAWINDEGSLLCALCSKLSKENIDKELRLVLPLYLIPKDIVIFDKFILNVNGKVDRGKTILEAEKKLISKEQPKLLPTNYTQKVLASIWKEVLELEDIGIGDNFFNLGGDSIKSIQILASIEKNTNISITPSELYSNPTILGIFNLIEKKKYEVDNSHVECKYEKEIKLFNEKYKDDSYEYVYPISDIVGGMIFHSEIDENEYTYHDQSYFYTKNISLDKSTVENCLKALILKHQTLRSGFNFSRDDAFHFVLHNIEVPLIWRDLSGIRNDTYDQIIKDLLLEDRKNKFITSCPPLWRMYILKLEEDRFCIVFSLHHAIMDGWSSALFWNEFFDLYLNNSKNIQYPISDTKCRYKDFLVEQFYIENNSSYLDFWSTELSGINDFSFNKKSMAVPAITQREVEFNLNKHLFESISDFSKSNGIPEKNVYLFCFKEAISRFSFEQDFAIGLIQNLRPLKEGGERLLGCFLNTVPVRFRTNYDDSLLKNLTKLTNKINDLLYFGRLPYNKIKKIVNSSVDTSLDIINSVFVYLDFHVLKEHAFEKYIDRSKSIAGHDKSNTYLDMIVNVSSKTPTIKIKYNPIYINDHHIHELKRIFIDLLKAIKTENEFKLVDLMPNVDWQLNASPYQKIKEKVTVSIERNAVQFSDSIALFTEDNNKISYRYLWYCVTNLAKELKEFGVVKGSRVAISLQKNSDFVITALAILHLDATFVPLDVSLPEQRKLIILDIAQIEVVVTDGNLYQFEHLKINIQKINNSRYKENQNFSINNTNPAYIIFTSGSTGVPKGVSIGHLGLSNLCENYIHEFQLKPGQHCLQYASISFDASISEIFPCLVAGSTLCFIDTKIRINPDLLLQRINYLNVSFAILPPEIATNLDFNLIKSLKTLVTAGSKPKISDVNKWISILNYVNAYGPTESTVCTSIYKPENKLEPDSHVPIGKPINGLSVSILDSENRPLAKGVVGEIVITGMGVALGYINSEEQNVHSFVEVSHLQGVRAYKTGDFGYINDDNNLVYLKRIDRQIKRNGVRIETQEIDSIISKLPYVKGSLTIFKNSLISFVVVDDYKFSIDRASEIKEYLRGILPNVLLPDQIQLVSEFPLNINGKIDIEKLTLIEPNLRRETSDLPKSFNDTLVEILGHKNFLSHQSFFEVGGDSIRALRLTRAINRLNGYVCNVSMIYESRSIYDLNLMCLSGHSNITSSDKVVKNTSTYYPISSSQKRFIAMHMYDADSTYCHMEGILSIEGDLDVDRLYNSVEKLFLLHPSLSTKFKWVSDQLNQEFFTADKTYPVLVCLGDQFDNKESAIQRLLEYNSRPFDIFSDWLVRFSYAAYDSNRFLLNICIHHTIADGWSIELLQKDLWNIYDSNRDVSENINGINYGDYSIWQNFWLDSPEAEKAKLFWKDQISDVNITSRLPYCFETNQENGSPYRIDFLLEKENYNQLLSLNSSLTGFELSYVIFSSWLCKILETEEVNIFTTVSGRENTQLHDLVGVFINTVFLKTKINKSENFIELSSQLQRELKLIRPFQEYPFDLVKDLFKKQGIEDPVKIGLTWIDKSERSFEIDDFIISPVKLNNKTAKSDLWLYCSSSNETINFCLEFDSNKYSIEAINLWQESFKKFIIDISTPSKHTIEINSLERPPLKKRKKSTRRTPKIFTEFFSDNQTLPLVVKPTIRGMSLSSWLSSERDTVDDYLNQYGAILFRDFNIDNPGSMQDVISAMGTNAAKYINRSTPRSEVNNSIYTSTEYPASEKIVQHHENAYSKNWPRLLWFCCTDDRFKDGQTPLADGFKVFNKIPNILIKEFMQKGIQYIRNYSDFLDLRWQEVFQTSDPKVVEEFCSNNDIDYYWKESGNLQTRHSSQVVLKHPNSNNNIWFNQIHLFHNSNLKKSIQSDIPLFDENTFPRNVIFGDGDLIPDEYINTLHDIYSSEENTFNWKIGDLLLVDNLRITHGRMPFTGKRKILVAMSEILTSDILSN